MKNFKNLFVPLVMTTFVVGFGMPTDAEAGECSGGLCGTPDQSGGGCGCGCGSILVAMTDRGDTYQFADDFDGDGMEDDFDNCPFAANFEQSDSDGDTVGDACDVCVGAADPLQENLDGDSFGDACDDDLDGDTIANINDNCPGLPNLAQIDSDTDLTGDACDSDDDNDGISDFDDPCRLVQNDPVTMDLLGTGNCNDDADGDGLDDCGPGGSGPACDNCPSIRNPMQDDADLDGSGDMCDIDIDGDGIENAFDNCFDTYNPGQVDLDRDGMGDAGSWGNVGLNESCDSVECYVVGGDPSNCMNPQGAFETRIAQLGENTIEVGQEVTLILFTNRLGEAHNWKTRFESLPDNSASALEYADSSATTLANTAQLGSCVKQGSEGGCQEYNYVRFTPDEPGTYLIRVNMSLSEGSDPMGLGASVATATATIEVGGESAGGCAAGTSSGLAALALGLLTFVRRRRK